MLHKAKKELDKKGQSLEAEIQSLKHDKSKIKSAEQDVKSAIKFDPARQMYHGTPPPQGHIINHITGTRARRLLP